MAEVIRALSALREGGTNEDVTAAAGVNPPPLPPPPPPPGSGVSHVNTSQVLQAVQWPLYGLLLGYTPSTAGVNPESGPSGTVEQAQPTSAGNTGGTGTPQAQVLNPVIIPRTPLGFNSPAMANPQVLGNPNLSHAPHVNPTVTSMAHPHYGVNGFPQNHLVETPQFRDKLQALEEWVRTIERSREARDPSLVPNMITPSLFKVPDFVKFEGITCPVAHVAMYYKKMFLFKEDDRLLIYCFQDSLAGEALSWHML